jgi:hypothetical protein
MIHMKTQKSSEPWLVVSIEGLRKTLERKGKSFAIFELVQNSWDADATEVVVNLTKPNKNGVSVLTCVDNAPHGYQDLSNAHTMFAESAKKTDATKRGRFNVGEKHVLALCDEATITSTTGQVIFNSDRTRTSSTKHTKVGSEFYGKMQLTMAEWESMMKDAQKLFPPVTTIFNGEVLPERTPIKVFETTLPTEVADERGILRTRQRKSEVRLYALNKGETAMLYEKGLPVVELQTEWHVDVQQKVPVNIERDSVSGAYEKAIYVAVLNEMHQTITNEESATKQWVNTALEDSRVNTDATQTVITARFGDKAVTHDPNDKGSNKECTAQGHTVVTGGALSKAAWANVKKAKEVNPNFMRVAGDVCPTDLVDAPDKIIPPEKYGDDTTRFVAFIERVSPFLLNHPVKVQVSDDKDNHMYGCTEWEKKKYIFTINLAYQDTSDWEKNYELLIHELAHHAVRSTDHLCRAFWESVTNIGARLAQLALQEPDLFEGTEFEVEPITAKESQELQLVAMAQ